MSYRLSKERSSIVISLLSLDLDLSFLEKEFSAEFKHLILDLSNFKDLDDTIFENFITFGNNIVQNNSFVMIYRGAFKENFPIVPSLLEAFDLIEMEEIERILN